MRSVEFFATYFIACSTCRFQGNSALRRSIKSDFGWNMMLRELESMFLDSDIKVGSTIYIVRKLSGHVHECKLIELSPKIMIEWKGISGKYIYKVDKKDASLVAESSSASHRNSMRRLWNVFGPQFKVLMKEHVLESKKK